MTSVVYLFIVCLCLLVVVVLGKKRKRSHRNYVEHSGRFNLGEIPTSMYGANNDFKEWVKQPTEKYFKMSKTEFKQAIKCDLKERHFLVLEESNRPDIERNFKEASKKWVSKKASIIPFVIVKKNHGQSHIVLYYCGRPSKHQYTQKNTNEHNWSVYAISSLVDQCHPSCFPF